MNPFDEALEELEDEQAPAPADPFSRALEETLGAATRSAETQIRTNVQQATTTTPDRRAEAVKLSQRTGLPVAVIERNFEDIATRAKVAETPYAQMLKETPVLAETIATDPDVAAIAADDLEPLGALEWLMTAPERAFSRGRAQVEYGLLAAQSITRDLTGAEEARLLELEKQVEAGGALGAGDSWFRKAVTGAAQQLPIMLGAGLRGLQYGIPAATTAGTAAAIGGQLGPQAALPEELVTVPTMFAAGLTAGTMAGGAQFGAELEAGLALQEFRGWKDEQGQTLDPRVARAAALAVGALNGGLEAAGLGLLLKQIPGARSVVGMISRDSVKAALRVPTVRAALLEAVQGYGTTIAGETAVEVTQRAVTILAGELAKQADGGALPVRTPTAIGADLLNEAQGAFFANLILAAPGPAMSAAVDARRARAAQGNVQFFEALGQGIQASKTATRRPEAVQSFLERATKGGPVETLYLDPDVWSRYWQSQGQDPGTVAAEVLGSRDEFEQATREGRALEIPTARYAVRLAGTPHNAVLAAELRLGPGEMNGREAAAFQEAQAAAQEAAGEATGAGDTQAGPLDAVLATVTARLEAAGYTPDAARQTAGLISAGLGRFAGLVDQTGEQYLERYGLSVSRPDMPAGQEAAVGVGLEERPAQEETPAAGEPNTASLQAVPEGENPLEEVIPGGLETVGEFEAEGEAAPLAGTPRAEAEAAAPAIPPELQAEAGETVTTGGAAVGARTETVTLDPNEPIAAMNNIGAAYLRLLAEDPQIIAKAEAMRFAAAAAHGKKLERPRGGGISESQLTDAEAAAPGTEGGERPPDLDRERARADEGGAPEGRGDAPRAHRRRLPTALELAAAGDPVFAKASAEADAARLTPEVRREVERIAEELEALPFTERTWTWLGPNDRKTGNAAGGNAIVVAGGAGAPVYDDVLNYAPINKGRGGAEMAKTVSGSRAQVLQAARKVLETGRINTNLAEGVVRVAERREADSYRDISRPMLPPSWGPEAPAALVGALSDSIDQLVDAGALETLEVVDEELSSAQLEEQGGDLTFDPTEFGQSLFDALDLAESVQLLEESAVNASGESAASLEALSRQAGMQARGETFVVYDKAGTRRPLLGPDAVDYTTREGETYGVEAAGRFRVIEDRGGKVPAPAAAEDVLETGEVQPRLPEAGEVREQEVATPEFEAPFALTAPVSKATKGKQTTLFQAAPPRERKIGPANAQGVAAYFIGWQITDLPDVPDFPLYNLVGGPVDGTTVTAEELEAQGIPIPETPPPPTVLEQPFFHGTPHNIVGRMSLERVGTGEGAAAYGWGLYLAEDPAVAASYFDQLSDSPGIRRMKLGSMVVGPENDFNYTRRAHVNDLENMRSSLAEDLLADPLALLGRGAAGFQALVLEMLDAKIASYRTEWPDGVATAQQLRKELARPGAVSIKFDPREGGVYQAEIAEEHVARMLDWDGLYDAQPPEVQRLFPADANGIVTLRNGEQVDRAKLTGKTIYWAASEFAGDAKEASLWFKAQGVPGLRYFDAGSRDVGKGTRNVVVFDDAIIELTHKDGSPLSEAERRRYFQTRRGQASVDQQRRGYITFGTDRKFHIALLAKADLSTFLHETGHFFLEVMGDTVEALARVPVEQLRPDQAQAMLDYAALLHHLGVERRDQITPEHHELMARTFEAYLMEGKAPSLELREAFGRFRSWLLGIYRALVALKAPLTEDVRNIFDRMLASEAAILQAQQEQRVEPMFLTAEAAGMDPAEFSLYAETVADASRQAREALDARLMRDVQRERERAWQEQRAIVRAEVQAQAEAAPVYRALQAIREGGLKLSRDMLVERFGKDRLRRLPRPFIYTRTGGVDPDAVAQAYGFASGSDLLTAIEHAPPLRQAIEQETDRRMIEAHGSILLTGNAHEEASKALANEAREEIVRKELAALWKLQRTARPFVRAGEQAVRDEQRERAYERRWLEAEAKLRIAIAEGRKQVEIDALRDELRELRAQARGGGATIRGAIPPAGEIRRLAEDRIRSTRISRLKPAVFWNASRKAAQKAIEAAARQDFDTAIIAKQSELLNLALYREANKVLEQVEKDVRFAQDLGSKASMARLHLAGESYHDQVAGILDRYQFAQVSQKALDRRASLRRWVAAQEGEGLPVDLPEELLEETRRVHYRELTPEELVGVVDGLRAIVHLARLKNRLLKAADERDLARRAGELAASIRQHARGTRARPARDRNVSEEKRRSIGDFFGSHRKLASRLREMDGFEDGGPAWEAIMRPLNEAGAREAEMIAEATQKFAELVERAFPGKAKRTLYVKRRVEAVGQSLSRMERIMVALNWGNVDNRQRVRDAEGWSEAQVQAVLDTLTPEDARFVQGVFDFINSYWPAIEAKEKRLTGTAPAKVEASRFTIGGVELAGGYFPLKYDDRLSAKAIRNLDLEAANLAKQAAYTNATTRRGHTKERAAKVKDPVRLDFGVMFEHVAQVIHDLTHHEALIDVGRILGHAEVSSAILETQGDLVYKQIRATLRDVAFGDVPAVNGFERAINHVRIGATIAGLGWNLTTSILQLSGFTNSIVRIGPKWVLRGTSRWLRDPVHLGETVTWIYERSAFMRSRGRTQSRELAEIRNALGVSTGKLSGWIEEALRTVSADTVTKQGIADSYFWMIQTLQKAVDVPTWLGAYEKALAAGETEERAVAMADQAVLDSQGGGQIKDLSQVQRGGPMMKLWTNFYSFFNVLYNQAVESTKRTRFRHPVEIGRLMSDYLLLFILPAVLGKAIRDALRPGEEDDDDAKGYALEVVGYLSGMMLGVREVAGTISGSYGYEGPAGARAFAGLARLGKQIQQGEADEAFFRALNDTAGVILHYPAGQVWRTLAGLTALAEGKTQNPGAVVQGAPRDR